MTWEDVFFSRDVDPKDIIKALAQVFKIKEQDVIIQCGSLVADVEDHISMICVLNIIRGDFPIHLEIAPWRKELVPQAPERYAILGRLCDQLFSPALVTSEQGNPYLWVLIRGEGDYQYVHLDEDKLDQPQDLIELEIIDDLYHFSHRLPELEIALGNLITHKEFEIVASGVRERFMSLLSSTPREDLLPILRNIRLEARRVDREAFLRYAIDWTASWGQK